MMQRGQLTWPINAMVNPANAPPARTSTTETPRYSHSSGSSASFPSSTCFAQMAWRAVGAATAVAGKWAMSRTSSFARPRATGRPATYGFVKAAARIIHVPLLVVCFLAVTVNDEGSWTIEMSCLLKVDEIGWFTMTFYPAFRCFSLGTFCLGGHVIFAPSRLARLDLLANLSHERLR